jgi:hypothetical protein
VTVVAEEAEAELPLAAAPHGAPCHHGAVPIRRRGGERRGLLKVGPLRRRWSEGGEPLGAGVCRDGAMEAARGSTGR